MFILLRGLLSLAKLFVVVLLHSYRTVSAAIISELNWHNKRNKMSNQTLDTSAENILRIFKEANVPPFHAVSIEQARNAYRSTRFQPDLPEVAGSRLGD
jgi:hypothetical protein